MLPEPIACTRCSFPRTLRLGEMRVCFQCRYSWRVHGVGLPKHVEPTLEPSACFTEAELKRLEAYRLAVLAGFYSDALQTRYRRSSHVSATRSWE